MLKKILKWTGITLLVLIVIISVYVAIRQSRTYEAPFPKVTISTDSATLARGEYLVFGPAHCADCHGDQSQLEIINSGGIVPLTGGYTFKIPPGEFRVPNITPDPETGIGNVPDSVLARSLRYGVRRDGTVLFDFMPFHNTSDDDLSAILSYIRSTKPVRHEVLPTRLNILGRVVNAFMIEPVGPTGRVLKGSMQDTTIEYGKYLAHSVANCAGCHTKRDLMTGAFIGEYFAGGFQMESLNDPEHYACVSPNLTPSSATGIMADWTEDTFIKRFRMGKLIKHSPMPWGPFRRMSDNDLKAIFRYLQSLKPVENKVEKTLIRIKD